MRVSRTLLAFAALLFTLVAACGPSSQEIVAPGATSANSDVTEGGTGQMGSGNAVAPDSTPPSNSTTERGGIGLLGSGN